jgi:hypothetical protein
VSQLARFKRLNPAQRAAVVFFIATGILLLAFLPLSGFPPHLALLGILSLITAFSLFTNRTWAPWLVILLLIVNSVFSLYTLYAVGFSNIIVAFAMISYVALTWAVAVWLWLRRKD